MSNEKTEHQPEWAVPYESKPVVVKIENPPELEALPRIEAPTIRPGDPMTIPIQVVAEPVSAMGKRGFIISPRPSWGNWEIYCDEGTVVGGKDEAPAPLMYLVSGVAFCLLSHITFFLEKRPMKIKSMKIEMRALFQTTVEIDDGKKAEGSCKLLECYVIIDSEEEEEKIARLVESCEQACMAMQSFVRAVPATAKLLLNGQERDLAT